MNSILLVCFILGFIAEMVESFIRREQATARVIIAAVVGGFTLALFAWILLHK